MSESKPTSRHSTVMVEVGSLKEEIDKLIAPLIRELWIAGIRTMMSCQEEEPKVAWIEFNSIRDLECLLNLVTTYEVGAHTLYNRIADDLYDSSATESWVYSLNALDCGGGRNGDDESDRSVDFTFTAGIRLPHSDLPILLAKLKEFNHQQSHDELLESESSADQQRSA